MSCVWDTAGNRVGFVRGGAFKVESPPRTFYVGLLLLRRAARHSGNHLASWRRALPLLYSARDGKNWYYWLAVWAIINTVVSFYYYVRFIRAMYLSDRVADDRPLALSPALTTALVVSLVGIIFIGIYPQPFIDIAQKLLLPR